MSIKPPYRHHTVISFAAAGKHVLPFGAYRGQTIDEAAQTDDGLRWLAWLRGARDSDYQTVKSVTLSADWRELQGNLIAYLDDPTIAKELDGMR